MEWPQRSASPPRPLTDGCPQATTTAILYQDLDDTIRFNTCGSLIVANNSGSVSTAGGELLARLMFGPAPTPPSA